MSMTRVAAIMLRMRIATDLVKVIMVDCGTSAIFLHAHSKDEANPLSRVGAGLISYRPIKHRTSLKGSLWYDLCTQHKMALADTERAGLGFSTSYN
jgi:hypothetical protein